MGGGAPLPTYMKPVAAPTAPNPSPPPTTTGPVLEPGMAGYGGPTEQQAKTIGDLYGKTGDYGQAVSQAMGSSPFNSDPGYVGANTAEQLGIPSINNNLNNLIAQRIVAYGDPSLAAQAGFGLDPQAAAFARQNYLSGNGQLARLDKSHEQARRAIINQLAAHGLIDSGDTGYQIGNEDQGYGNNVYDAQQQALADILGYRNNAQTQLSNLHQQTISALENAFTNYANNPAAYGQTASTPPAVTSITPPKVPKPAVPKAVVKALVNPYTTGQKRFG